MAVGFTSCGNKEEEPKVTPPPAPSATDTARASLFHEMVYTMGRIVSTYSASPELNAEVRNMLVLLQDYYQALCNEGGNPQERANIALRIAEVTKDLGAFPKAQSAYETANKELANLLQDFQNSTEGLRMQSAISNGTGLCLLSQNKAGEALPYYEKALALDEKIAAAILPEDIASLQGGDLTPEISRAVSDVLGSYRCLGDCQIAAEDPEEARTTYQKGLTLVEQFQQTTPQMALAAARLISTWGNLESSTQNEARALQLWRRAAGIYEQIFSSSPQASIKAQAQRYYMGLKPSIEKVSRSLQQETEQH